MSRGGQGGRGYGGRGRGYNNTGNMGMSHNQGYGHSRGGYSGGYNSQPGYGYNNVNDIKDKAVDILNKLTNVLRSVPYHLAGNLRIDSAFWHVNQHI